MKKIAKWVVMTSIVTAVLIGGFHTSEKTYAADYVQYKVTLLLWSVEN
jgi:hypothetical protein